MPVSNPSWTRHLALVFVPISPCLNSWMMPLPASASSATALAFPSLTCLVSYKLASSVGLNCSLPTAQLLPLSPSILPTISLIADLCRCLPSVFCMALCIKLLSALLQDSLTLTAATTATSHAMRCFTTTTNPLPLPSAWDSAYTSDPTTATLLHHLSSGLAWSPLLISGLHPLSNNLLGTTTYASTRTTSSFARACSWVAPSC